MANFEGHLSWGFGTGVILSVIGLKFHHIQPIEMAPVAILAMVGASIPDIDYGRINATDSKTGRPIERESKPFQIFTSLLSLSISILSAYYFYYFIPIINAKIKAIPGIIISTIIFYIIFYLAIRWLLKNVTTHRGVMHSIPFAILCAELTYLIFSSEYTLTFLASLFKIASEKLPEYSAAAVFLGFISHLIVDEAHSIGWGRRNRTSYFGTAFTMYSKNSSLLANFILYSLVIALLFAINSKITAQSLLAMVIALY